MIPLATIDAALVLLGAIGAGIAFFGLLGLVLWFFDDRRERRRKRAAKREQMRSTRSPLFEVPIGQTRIDYPVGTANSLFTQDEERAA